MRVYNINHIIFNSVTACQDTSFSTNAMAPKVNTSYAVFFRNLVRFTCIWTTDWTITDKINFRKRYHCLFIHFFLLIFIIQTKFHLTSQWTCDIQRNMWTWVFFKVYEVILFCIREITLIFQWKDFLNVLMWKSLAIMSSSKH